MVPLTSTHPDSMIRYGTSNKQQGFIFWEMDEATVLLAFVTDDVFLAVRDKKIYIKLQTIFDTYFDHTINDDKIL